MRVLCLAILSSCTLCLSAQWGIGIDAEPLLLYSGNLLGGQVTAPQWQGSEGQPNALDLYRYREEHQDWIRYRLAMSVEQGNDRIRVQALNDDLSPIMGVYSVDELETQQVRIQLGIQQEHWIGQKRLKGIWSKGLALSTARDFSERSTTNPLAAYASDTLYMDSGYSFGLALFVQTGLLYELSANFILSARLGYGLQVRTRPESEIRRVSMVGASAELISEPLVPASSLWRVDSFLVPQFTLTFFFDTNQERAEPKS